MSSDSIPSELIYEILSQLPAPTLVKFKCVCKAWRDMIDGQGFIRSHLDRRLLNSLSDGTDDQLVFIDKIKAYGNSSSFVPVGSLLNSSGETETIKTIPLRQRNPLKLFNHLDLVIPCNGVMFLSGIVGNSFSSILCNPLTGESHKLPEPATSSITGLNTINLMLMSAGFGYDYAHDDYKVVLLLDPPHCSGFEMETMIYSLKLDFWRWMKNFPYIIVKSDGIYLNGALHWIASSTEPFTNKDDLIVGIDLGTEDYFEMRIPPENIISGQRRFTWQLNVLGGCISLICFYHTDAIMDLWLMEDYKVESSWRKLFSIVTPEYQCYFPVIYSRSRRTVLLENQRFCVGSKLRSPEYVCLDLDNLSTRNVRVDGQATFLIAAHLAIFNVLETLVRLNTPFPFE